MGRYKDEHEVCESLYVCERGWRCIAVHAWGGGHALLAAVRTVAALRRLGTAAPLLSGSVPR